jgi:hypothetical protein
VLNKLQDIKGLFLYDPLPLPEVIDDVLSNVSALLDQLDKRHPNDFIAARLRAYCLELAFAATKETLTAPFVNGPNGATTTDSYIGSVSIRVAGHGQAAETAYSDAFYVFTDGSGNPITPEHHRDFGLCINDEPVENYLETIPSYRSNHTYQFTISLESSSQQITFGVCDTFTVDNSGSFNITVTAREQAIIIPNEAWAGYGVSGSPFPTPSEPKKVLYSKVKGSWRIPDSIYCGSDEHSKAAFWVGLGGSPNGNLEQIGTLIQCDEGELQYDAVYEIIQEGSGIVNFIEDTYPTYIVNPGDHISAEVRHLGGERYRLSITNIGQWSFVSPVLSGSKKVSARDAALWIAEAPSLNDEVVPLTYFGTVSFLECQADGQPISDGRTINQFEISNTDSEAEASPLDSTGMSFTVKMPPQS